MRGVCACLACALGLRGKGRFGRGGWWYMKSPDQVAHERPRFFFCKMRVLGMLAALGCSEHLLCIGCACDTCGWSLDGSSGPRFSVNSLGKRKRERAGLAGDRGPCLAPTFSRSQVSIYYVFICDLLCVTLTPSPEAAEGCVAGRSGTNLRRGVSWSCEGWAHSPLESS